MRTVPRTTIELHLFAWLSEKAFFTVDWSKDGDYNTLLNYSLETRLTRKSLNEQANRILPKPKLAVTSNLPMRPPDSWCMKGAGVWHNGGFSSKMKGPYWVVLRTPAAVNVDRGSLWAHTSEWNLGLLLGKPTSKLTCLFIIATSLWTPSNFSSNDNKGLEEIFS